MAIGSGARRWRTRGVANDGRAGRNVSGDYAARADDGVVADGDAGKDDGSAADPYVGTDADGATALKAGAASFGIARMVGGVDLDGGADLGLVTDFDGGDVEQDAVEVKEDAAAEADVVAIVAEKWRTDDGAVTAGGEELAEQRGMSHPVVGRGVVLVEQGGGVVAVGDESGVASVVELAREHLFFFGFFWLHDVPLPLKSPKVFEVDIPGLDFDALKFSG